MSSTATTTRSSSWSTEGVEKDDPHCLTSTYRNLADDLDVGQSVLFADGTVAMDVVARGPGWARLKVTLPGRIRSNQGINVPRTGLSVAALTDKDLADLDWTATHDVDYVGLSFVRKAEDIALLRRELERRGSRARIIAKIEKPQALANLDAIVAEADAVMVARGDLGVELDVVRVPAIQKQIIDACHRARVPVITATQMLNSMETEQPANPCRGQRRIQRRARRHRCRDALGRDGDRSIPRRSRRHDEPDRQRGRDVAVFRVSHRRALDLVGRELARRRGTRRRTGGEPRRGAGRPGPADHRERRRGRQLDIPAAERGPPGRRHLFRPHGPGALQAPQPRPNSRRGQRPPNGPRHGPVLGSHPASQARPCQPRRAPRLHPRLVPAERTDRTRAIASSVSAAHGPMTPPTTKSSYLRSLQARSDIANRHRSSFHPEAAQ